MYAPYAVAFGRGQHRHALRESAARAGLSVKADLPNVLVLAGEQTCVLASGDAALIGQLFGASNERVHDLGAAGLEAAQLPWMPGCWGNFAFFRADGDRSSCVYRDPSGSVPVYRISGATGDIYVSDTGVAAALGLIEPNTVDLGFAVQWLQFPHLRSSRTGLENVREVLPGTCVRGRDGSCDEALIWNPWEHVRRSKRIDDPAEAARALRTTALGTVAAQVSAGPVLLQLSGGLDSSVLAACLHHGQIPFEAINFVSGSADGNEQRYARIVADACGIRLHEIHEAELTQGLEVPAERTFRPGSNPVLVPLDRAVEQHRREAGARLLLDGGGGDNLFCYLTSAAPIVDALRAARPRTAVLTLGNVAERANCTWWEAVRATLRRTVRWRAWRWVEDRRFLNREVLLPGSDPHPWLRAPALSFPGKREHVASLVQVQHFLDRRPSRGAAMLHPLLAQPLLELCLAIPSWLWVRGGIDRAVAREAFGDLLPRPIVQRRTKGSLQGLFHRYFAQMRDPVRELLLTGELRRLGMIESAAVEQAFADGSWAEDDVQMRLSEMAALDLWLQSWRR